MVCGVCLLVGSSVVTVTVTVTVSVNGTVAYKICIEDKVNLIRCMLIMNIKSHVFLKGCLFNSEGGQANLRCWFVSL